MVFRAIPCVTLCAIFGVSLALCAPAAPSEAVASIHWKHVSTRDYEAEHPGLGFSRRFVSSAGWADEFVYDAGRKTWKNGVDDPQLEMTFQMAVRDVGNVAGPGADYRLMRVDHLQIAGRPFLHAAMRMKVEGRMVESHLYLTAVEHRLVKFRISLYVPLPQPSEAVLAAFVADQMRFVLSHPFRTGATTAPSKREIAIRLEPGCLDKPTGVVWLSYALARADYWRRSGRSLTGAGELEPGFAEELGARRSALEAYRAARAKTPGLRSAYWDALAQVEQAGFLAEYVWTYLRQGDWTAGEEPAELARFDAWRRVHLGHHRPETRAGLVIQVEPASP